MSSKTEKTEWTLSKGTWIKPTKTPGVSQCKDGGFLIRGEAVSPLTGKPKDVRRVLRDVRTEYEARHILDEELARIRTVPTASQSPERLKFGQYIARFLEAKVKLGRIRSAATKELWAGFVNNWWSKAPWFDYYLDVTTSQHLVAWRDDVLGSLVNKGEMSPLTANGMLAKLRQVWAKAVKEELIGRNPMSSVEDFDTSTTRTYSHDEPNSLETDETPAYLAKMRQMFRHHYCQVLIGFVTGLRPSSLRPLRRKGPDSDLLWEKRAIVIRRSHTRKQIVLDKSKTRKNHEQPDQVLTLPEAVWDVIREHIDGYETDAQIESDLLFPSREGLIQSPSALQKPFAKVHKALGLDKRITPRAMRRTSGDILRTAGVDLSTRMAISGHKSEKMKKHYETVPQNEIRTTLEQALDLATGGNALRPGAPKPPDGGATGRTKGQPVLRRVK